MYFKLKYYNTVMSITVLYLNRLSGITPHHFVLIQRKELLTMLKSALLRDVSVISVQAAPHGDLDVLLAFAGVCFNLSFT